MTQYSADWYQQTLEPLAVIEATLKVGVIPEADHVQTWYELKDPTTGVLIGAGSVPHTGMRDLATTADKTLTSLIKLIQETVSPF